MKELDNLATIAVIQLHAAHATFTHGLSSKWSYLTRTIRDIPVLTGQSPPDDEILNLLTLLARLGGIDITSPTPHADVEFSTSMKITDPLKDAILKQSFEYMGDVVDSQLEDDVRKLKPELCKQASDSVKQNLSNSLKRSMDLAQERGASNWLTTLPIQKFGFMLHKCFSRCLCSLLQLATFTSLSPLCLCLWHKVLC